MGYLELLESASIKIRKKNNEADVQTSLDLLPTISLKQFKNRNLAVLVHSEFLDDYVWFCSNDDMAKQIQNDDKDAVTYTADELIEIVKLSPNLEGLKSINDAKKVFKYSNLLGMKKMPKTIMR